MTPEEISELLDSLPEDLPQESRVMIASFRFADHYQPQPLLSNTKNASLGQPIEF